MHPQTCQLTYSRQCDLFAFRGGQSDQCIWRHILILSDKAIYNKVGIVGKKLETDPPFDYFDSILSNPASYLQYFHVLRVSCSLACSLPPEDWKNSDMTTSPMSLSLSCSVHLLFVCPRLHSNRGTWAKCWLRGSRNPPRSNHKQ